MLAANDCEDNATKWAANTK